MCQQMRCASITAILGGIGAALLFVFGNISDNFYAVKNLVTAFSCKNSSQHFAVLNRVPELSLMA